jgi:integrase
VPLSDRAVEILLSLKPLNAKDDEYIFPGYKRGLPLSNMAMLECLRNIRKGVTVHGFRSSFRDWAGDHTSFPREITEAALAHVIKDKAEGAYRRRTALEKRRRLMMAWQQFLGTGNNVISLAR